MAYGRTDTTGSGPLPTDNDAHGASRRTRTCDAALHAHTDQSVSQLGLPLRTYGGAWSMDADALSVHDTIDPPEDPILSSGSCEAPGCRLGTAHGRGRMSPESPSAAASRSPLGRRRRPSGIGRHLMGV